jgi:hypothetical protein
MLYLPTHCSRKAKVAVDPGDLFWTHLELLRKCKFVAVVQKNQGGNQLGLDKRKYSIGPKGQYRFGALFIVLRLRGFFVEI